MRINNWKHFPWLVFVCLATIAACILYTANFHPARLPSWIHLPSSLIQKPTEHHTVGGTPLGLWFGSISLGIFVFAALLSLRKKIPLWRVGTVQRWLRAHIWLTILTIPLVILHSGFRFGGGMTTFLMLLYGIVMVSGFYGLFLQHIMPRLMKERLPAETVFEQIPHIRSQLAVAAEKMRDSFKPAPPKKTGAAAPAPSAAKTATAPAAVMASTKGELSTPVARAKSTTGSTEIAAPVVAAGSRRQHAFRSRSRHRHLRFRMQPSRRPRQRRRRSARRRHACKATRRERRWHERKFPPAISRRRQGWLRPQRLLRPKNRRHRPPPRRNLQHLRRNRPRLPLRNLPRQQQNPLPNPRRRPTPHRKRSLSNSSNARSFLISRRAVAIGCAWVTHVFPTTLSAS